MSPRCADVIVISLTSFFGGGERYVSRLAALLSGRLGMSFIVRCGELEQMLARDGFVVKRIKSAFAGAVLLGALVEALSRRRGGNVRWVILNGQFEAHLVLPLRVLGFRTLLVRHTSISLTDSRLKCFVYWISAAFANQIVVVSRQGLLEHGRFERKVTQIHNWVDTSSGTSVVAGECRGSAADNAPVPLRVIYIGRLVKEKGVEDLLAAVSRLVNVQLDIYGDGPLAPMVESAAKMSPVVIYHGFHREADRLLSNYDVLVLPSYSEGMPISVVDAMAFGVTCVLSDIPSLRELADGGQAAVLFKVGNRLDLAAKLAMLRDMPALRRDVGLRGKARAHGVFSREAAQAAYLKILCT